LICLHGLADLSDDVYHNVIRHADKIEYEPWMLQSGGELCLPCVGQVPGPWHLAPLSEILLRTPYFPARDILPSFEPMRDSLYTNAVRFVERTARMVVPGVCIVPTVAAKPWRIGLPTNVIGGTIDV
jgi:hypothetical protein